MIITYEGSLYKRQPQCARTGEQGINLAKSSSQNHILVLQCNCGSFEGIMKRDLIQPIQSVHIVLSSFIARPQNELHISA